MKPQLVGLYVRAGAQPAFEPGEDALDQSVKSDGGEVLPIGFHSDPAVIIEHICFLTERMNDVHQRLRLFRNKALNEVHVVPLVRSRRPVGRLQLSAVDKILRRQGISIFPPERIQRGRADRKVVARPVGKPGAAAKIRPEDPNEIVEQRRQPDHVRLRVVLAPDPQPVLQILPRAGVPGIELAQVLGGPAVGRMVVHVDFFPDAPAQEGNGIAMIRRALPDRHFSVPEGPVFPRNLFSLRPVPYLPPGQGIGRIVQLKLLIKISVQWRNLQLLRFSDHRVGGKKRLLLRIGMLAGKGIMLPDDTDCRVDPVPRFRDLRRKLCPVAVADHIRSPSFRHFQRQLFITRFSREREPSLPEINLSIAAHEIAPLSA